MQTIRLRVNDKVYKNLLRFLSKFSNDEIQIIEEDDTFISVRQYLENELKTVEDGSAKYIDIDELDSSLDSTIRKHET